MPSCHLKFLSHLAGNLTFLLGAVFIASLIFVLFQRGKGSSAWTRIRNHRKRDAGCATPPRSLSPEQKECEGDYSNTFPPSRCFSLSNAGIYQKLGMLSEKREESPVDWTKNILPLETSYLNADPTKHTPCQFSIQDIKNLGDFPDYATLSGIPSPAPYPEFDIKKALPRPYRPFRWAYHQTMSLTKMEPDWWLELENTYSSRIQQRQELFAQHGEGVLCALPGSELACKELMEMCLQFLCARYPQYFSLDREKLVFYNGIMKTEKDIKRTNPLHVLLDNVPEDFALMLRDDKTGLYVFRAGIICSALGWNVESKIGLRLHEIHAPIPDYKEKMQFSMDRYFAKNPTDKAIQRGSWGLEVDQPLYMPPGDPHEKYRDYQDADLTLSRCHLRVDWQTLRRLPLSGAVAFNFKGLFTPVEEFRDEPFVPGLLLKGLNEGKKSIMEYKNTWHVEHVVKPALERYHAEQVERGLVPSDWEPHTLEESPWFPGWQEKWHLQQGF